jgi:pyrroloquinoline-quinone synthase
LTLGEVLAGLVYAVREIDALVRRRHLLQHPFYRAWSEGRLDREILREYAEQYYWFESNFPRYVAATYARLASAADRRELLDNLVDEEGRSPTHPELWLDFLRSLHGPTRADRIRPPTAATRRLLRTYEREAFSTSPARGLGVLYAYEKQFPEVAAEKSRGLRAFYGIRSRGAHEFFRVHATADVAHSASERALLGRVLRGSPSAPREARAAVAAGLDAWWSFLDSFLPAIDRAT